MHTPPLLAFTFGLAFLSLGAIPIAHAATSLTGISGQGLESDEVSLSDEARVELDGFLNEPYRAPANLEAATTEPSGENANLYLNALDQLKVHQSEAALDSPAFDVEADPEN